MFCLERSQKRRNQQTTENLCLRHKYEISDFGRFKKKLMRWFQNSNKDFKNVQKD
jgi:hypothetical protein